MKLDALQVLRVERLMVPEPWIALNVPGHAGAVLLPYLVMGKLVLVLERLDPEKAQRAGNGNRLVKAEFPEIAHLQRSPGEHHRDAGGNEHRCVARANRNVQQP